MRLSGKVTCAEWSVAADTHEAEGGFGCSIRVEQHRSDGVLFEHNFEHCKTFESEREAVLAGLREGMVWINLKLSSTIIV
ncbi:UDP-glucose 4-epimerase [Caballeronia terrestris]|uniref:UDP-glucose 4-epimerase n=2 Tax=Caballeronia TaxID=1827195 RepID=A0A158KXN3_9BURK|nr:MULTISPECIES: UDP-glucose 4-epimerase [Caballeronia]SAL61725.1 UDP-glucose 4-epimerase [Caballeronia humi]SAL85916.1 UDP-glucose 4-epimerase [Caballeronia terrestris]